MNLVCIWCQRLLSYRAVEATSIPESPWMREHRMRCASCAQASNEFNLLTRRLSEVTESGANHGLQKAEILERVIETNNPRQTMPAYYVGFATLTLLMVIWLGSRPERSRDTSPAAALLLPRSAGSPMVASLTEPSKAMKGKRYAQIRKTRKANSTHYNRNRRVRIRRPVMLARSDDAVKAISTPDAIPAAASRQTATVTIKWEQVGAWYEAGGDHERALAAYRKAFEDRPSPDLAFTTGRAAECAGDISSAVEFYAKALEPIVESESESEKGSAKCIDARSSV